MSASLAALSISVLFSFLLPKLWIGLIIGFLLFLFTKKTNKVILILGFSLLILRVWISFDVDPFYQGRIVELNKNSVLMQKGFNKILVLNCDVNSLALGDVIQVNQIDDLSFSINRFGFQSEQWAKANHIVYQASYQNTIKEANSFLQWLSMSHANNIEFQAWYRHLLFQVSMPGVMGLLFSVGILFVVLIDFLEKILDRFQIKQPHIIIFTVLIILLFTLGSPLSLVRISVFRLVKKCVTRRDHHFFYNVLILFLIEPYGFTQLAWIIPLALSAHARFSFNHVRFFERSLVLIVSFLSVSVRFSLIHLILYPQLKKIFPYLITYLLTARFFLFLQISFVGLMNSFNQVMLFVQNMFVMNGHLSALSAILILILYQFKLNKFLWLSCFILVIAVINPLSILPLSEQITMINVNQGDSILLQSRFNKEVILIDTGNTYARDTVLATLDYYGLKKIDVISISHQDADHSANTQAIKDYVNVKVEARSKENIPFANTELIFLDNGNFKNENDNSKVYYLALNNMRYLFSGDMSAFVEKQMLKRYPDIKVDILKVAHHGSNTATSNELLHQLEVSVGLISVGSNDYGHPSTEVLARLYEFHVEAISTFTEGDLILRSYGFGVWIESANFSHWFIFAR